VLSSPEANAALDDAARRLVAGATEIASALTYAVRKALNIDSADASILGGLREAFYAETRESFFEALSDLVGLLEEDPEAPEALSSTARGLLDKSLGPTALRMFDAESPLDPTLGRETDIQRVVEARFWLWLTLEGRGKGGQTLFERLALAAPEPKGSKTKGKGRAAKP